MRTRSLAVLSAAALSALLLTGCSGSADPTPSATTASATDLCSAIVASGDASESVTVDGEAGTESTATFETPIEIITEPQTTHGRRGVRRAGGVGRLREAGADRVRRRDRCEGRRAGFQRRLLAAAHHAGRRARPAPRMSERRARGTCPSFREQPTRAPPLRCTSSTCSMSFPPTTGVRSPNPETPSRRSCFDDAGVPTITIPAADPPAEVQLAGPRGGRRRRRRARRHGHRQLHRRQVERWHRVRHQLRR